MHLRLIAVGIRQPAWVDSAFDDYSRRMPQAWQFGLKTIAAAGRKKNQSGNKSKEAEGAKILASIKPGEIAIVMDERGNEVSSRDIANQLLEWQNAGQDIAFVIGGPDGVSSAVTQRANLTWSMSKLTLPHGLARVLFAEQLYRAWSLSAGHPYHRD